MKHPPNKLDPPRSKLYKLKPWKSIYWFVKERFLSPMDMEMLESIINVDFEQSNLDLSR